MKKHRCCAWAWLRVCHHQGSRPRAMYKCSKSAIQAPNWMKCYIIMKKMIHSNEYYKWSTHFITLRIKLICYIYKSMLSWVPPRQFDWLHIIKKLNHVLSLTDCEEYPSGILRYVLTNKPVHRLFFNYLKVGNAAKFKIKLLLCVSNASTYLPVVQ